MRIKILEDTPTVGLMLYKGQIADVDDPLAKALIAQGKAIDPYAPVIPEPEVETVEVVDHSAGITNMVVAADLVPEPVTIPDPEAAVKVIRKAAKKPARKAK
jgi:hypothetical protein